MLQLLMHGVVIEAGLGGSGAGPARVWGQDAAVRRRGSDAAAAEKRARCSGRGEAWLAWTRRAEQQRAGRLQAQGLREGERQGWEGGECGI